MKKDTMTACSDFMTVLPPMRLTCIVQMNVHVCRCTVYCIVEMKVKSLLFCSVLFCSILEHENENVRRRTKRKRWRESESESKRTIQEADQIQ